MNRIDKILLLLTVCFANCFSLAQPAKNVGIEKNYQSIPWDIDHGLSIGRITCMLKDRYGFLWIGTNVALNRFDGSRFINHFPDKNKSGTISSGNIQALIQDSLGNIWIGTSLGLSRYDHKTDTFSNFLSPVNPNLNFAFVIPFWATQDEVFCIEMSSQITAYNIRSFKKRTVVKHFDNNLGNQIFKYRYSVMDIRTNSVWMLDKGGLLEVSLMSGTQTHYTPEKSPNDGNYNDDDYIMAMCYDPERKLIWLNTYDGLVQFNLTNKKFVHFDAFKDMFKSPHFWADLGMDLDPQGSVIFATGPKGIFIFEPTSQVIKLFLSKAESKSQGIVGFIYCDRDGIVWTGNSNTKSCIYQNNPVNPTVIRYVTDTTNQRTLSFKQVSSMVKGPQGKVWIGTWDGMDIFDPATGLFKILREKDLPGFRGRNIIPVVIDTTQQKTWIKAWAPDAMFEMDIRTRECRRLTIHDTTFNHRLTWDITAEEVRPFQQGIIFPIQNEGIFAVKKDSLVAYQELAIPHQISRTIVADDRFLFLRLGSARKNLTYTYVSGKWVLASSPLDSVEWSNIFFDKKDYTFWVGAFKEIIHYDKDFRVIRRYTDGFPGFDVVSILADDYGDIWFANGTGKIARLNPQSGKFITLSEKDGFRKQTFSWVSPTVKDEGGDLYFAGADGIDRIRPNRLKDTYPPSHVYIHSIQVNQNPFAWAAGVNQLNELSLKYHEKNINIETGTLDYYSQGSSRIRYKLEGITQNWQYAPNGYIIRLNGLAPGTYTLVIQASNAIDDFNGPEKKLIINISPAFWNTWWFYILIGIILTTGMYVLFRYRLQQKINLLEMRNRISQDLHDEIGASISGINLLSQMASDKLQNNDPEEASSYLFKVKNYTQDVIEKLDDMVWLFKPQNDSIEKLLQRLKSFAISIALSKKIKIHFETDKESETRHLTIRERKAVYLISKEALNNIFKYADCSNIYYSLHSKTTQWQLIIKDDGKGFMPAEDKGGNGLKNMEARAEEIGATFNIQSESGSGTVITVEF